MARQAAARAHFRTEVTRRLLVEPGGEEVVFLARHALEPARRRLFSLKDLRPTALILASLLMTAVLPRASWAGFADVVARPGVVRRLRRRLPAFARSVAAVLGETDPDRVSALLRDAIRAQRRRVFYMAAERAGPRRRPGVVLHGADGIRAALARGRGAIIWCSQFAAQTLIGKRALSEAGILGHQVSVAEHGFSHTAYGRRFLNPPLIRVENRSLAGRVVFDRGETFEVTRRIAAILKQNGVVLMTNNAYSGSSFVEVGMGPAGYLRLASTPLNFAVRSGAALFCMTTFERVPFARYEAVISPEIPVAQAAGDAAAAAIARAALAVRDRLLADLRQCPEQFMLWGSIWTSSIAKRRSAAPPSE